MSETLISLSNASKSFGKIPVLRDLLLSINRGELVVVLGANGAGKTTLLRIIAGLLGLDQGRLEIDGETLDRFSEKQREKLYFLPDFPVLFREITVLENVEVFASLYQKSETLDTDHVMALLERFGIAEKSNRLVATLSRGQLFKLAIVCYEVVQAEVGLFDEPFASGMDAPGLREMKKLLRESTQSGKAVIYTTQLVSYALEFADRVLLIHDASIYFDGTPEAFAEKMNAGDPVLTEFSDKE